MAVLLNQEEGADHIPMHETAIVGSLFEVINRQVAQHGVRKVNRVRLKVGDFAVVEPMTLTACFEVFSAGTVVEGAELLIEKVPIIARCRVCRLEFAVENYDFRCPGCHSGGADMLRGKELYIDSLDVET